MKKPLRSFLFDDAFVRRFPGDPDPSSRTREVKGVFYVAVTPTPPTRPRLIGWSENFAAEFGLERPTVEGEDTDILAGKTVPPGARPYAALYGGHQFGHWAGQLGDGRAITLGEIKDLQGHSWDLQLKGAGPTAFSRRADGRAVLRSSLREFLCSEAMAALGVPTTRALSLVLTGDSVVRDMFYDGHPEREPGAITSRLAPSFLRFGNFEIFASRHDLPNLGLLVEDTLRTHYPELNPEGEAPALTLFREVCQRTVRMGVDWMRVGFVHGVMNTDNMSILGLTIDYGPYGWIDNYDPSWTPNTTDLPGRRYAFGRQPSILLWNLAQLASALVTLNPDALPGFQQVMEETEALYGERHVQMMADKLGLSRLEGPADIQFILDLEKLLFESEADMTLFYRGLADLEERPSTLPSFLKESFYQPEAITADLEARWIGWLGGLFDRLPADLTGRRERMNGVNPVYVPRNYLAQEAIDAATLGDFSKLETLMEVLSQPYTERAGLEAYKQKRPDWARSRPGCSTLSCSS